MPRHTTHSLITWVPGSEDGRREARRLQRLFSAYSDIRAPGKISPGELGYYMNLIVVGHRSEISQQLMVESLVRLVGGSGCPWLILANCHSGVAHREGTLGNNELLDPAQALANRLRIRVSGTGRVLTFDEVGRGTAFALALGEILIRSNPPGGGELWRDFEPQSGLDQLTTMFQNL